MGRNLIIFGEEQQFFLSELVKFLEKEGFSVQLSNYVECSSVNTAAADMILFDVSATVGAFEELLHNIDSDLTEHLIPTIAFVPQSPKTLKKESYRLGVDEVFDKPVDLALLLERINNLFHRREVWSSTAGPKSGGADYFTHLDLPAIVSDLEMNIIAANKKAIGVFGHQLLGKSLLDLYPEDKREGVSRKMSPRSEIIEHFSADLRINGDEKRFVISVERILSESGTPVGFMKFFFSPSHCAY